MGSTFGLPIGRRYVTAYLLDKPNSGPVYRVTRTGRARYSAERAPALRKGFHY